MHSKSGTAMAHLDHTATVTLDRPTTLVPSRKRPVADARRLDILGVRITDVTPHRAVEIIEEAIRDYLGHTQSIYFVNAHTLNLATADASYRAVLNSADYVFGDGTGVRWASKLQGTPVQDNLVGTDLVPTLFQQTAGRGYRYFMLGSDAETIRQAAQYADEDFDGWTRSGFHHGYLTNPGLTAAAIRLINQSEADVLLVGMGNPLQERWIHRHRHKLKVPVCMAIGGLFDYWAGNVSRAPRWLRGLGHEWLWRPFQQPGDKARRYLIGNPLFLSRILREPWRNRS